MYQRVIRARRANDKILGPVVQPIFVDVVNNRAGRQRLPKSFFRNLHMLVSAPAAVALSVTFVPLVFSTVNVVGGSLWAIGLTTAGYLLGNTIPSPDKYLLPVIALIIVISLAPAAIHLLMERRRGASEAAEVTETTR